MSKLYTINCPQREGMYPANIGFVFLNKKFLSRVMIVRQAATRNDPAFPIVLDVDADEDGVVEVFFDGQLLVAESGSSLRIDPYIVFVNRYNVSDKNHDLYVQETKKDLLACGISQEIIDQYTF